MTDTRLRRQLDFIVEIDKLKLILRRISVIGGSRLENSAEHSWHLGVMVPLLAEYAPAEVDVAKVMKMLLIHDVVEIDAGDTFCFDEEANLDKEEREIRAADRLFGLLPDDQRGEVRALWDEFEAGSTHEAAFANAMDRLQGLLMNYGNGGGTWLKYGITREQVLKRMGPIREGAPEIWPFVLEVVDGALKEEAEA